MKKKAPKSRFAAARLAVALRETVGGEIVSGADGTQVPASGTCSCNWTCTNCCASITGANAC